MVETQQPAGAPIGLAWYDARDYERVRQVMVDGDSFPPTFAEWDATALRIEMQHGQAGRHVIRVYIDPDEFVARCAKTGREAGARARSAWAGLVAVKAARRKPPAGRT